MIWVHYFYEGQALVIWGALLLISIRITEFLLKLVTKITFLITNGYNKRELMIGCEYMDTTKARIQRNAVVPPIPKSLGVEPGTEYRFIKESDGSLKLTPTKKVPETMAELFKGWHGKYEIPTDLQGWDGHDSAGEELW